LTSDELTAGMLRPEISESITSGSRVGGRATACYVVRTFRKECRAAQLSRP
jgi:hypothetical protein